jgi:hypothetical protein
MTYEYRTDDEHYLIHKRSPPSESYLAGLIDGDGCIFIRKIQEGFQSGVSVAQCRTNVLQIIRYHFGGTITTSSNRNNRVDIMDPETGLYHKYNKRNEYNLTIRSNEYDVIIPYIQNHLVVKTKQMECLCKMAKIVDIPHLVDEKMELHEECAEYNKYPQTNVLCLDNVNMEYICGLFDAEGCVYIDKQVSNRSITIAQKNHPQLLHRIANILGYGHVYETCYTITKSEDCMKFISMAKPHVIVKYNQLVAFELFLRTTDVNDKKSLYILANAEKHKTDLYEKSRDIGKFGFQQTMLLRNTKLEIGKEIRRIQVYKEKSVNMRGENNHNYGKRFSEDTRQKMSRSIRDAKNGICDENIQKVREYIRDGKSNQEIQQMMNLSRDTVYKIKCGLLVCRTETKDERPILSKTEQNIQKRKISLDCICKIVDYTLENKKPSEIFDLLESGNPITIDIIKNIKRSMSQNKVPFYPMETTPACYENYQDKISIWCNEN